MLSYFLLHITREIHEPHSEIFAKIVHFQYYTRLNVFCFLVSVPIRRIYHIFLFSSHFLFHTNLNLVHVLVLVSSFRSSSIVLSLFHTNLNLVHVLVLVSSFHSSSIVLSLFHTNLNLVHVLVLVSSFRSSSIVLTVHFFLGLRLHFKHNIDLS